MGREDMIIRLFYCLLSVFICYFILLYIEKTFAIEICVFAKIMICFFVEMVVYNVCLEE
jgi:hypothetical protein